MVNIICDFSNFLNISLAKTYNSSIYEWNQWDYSELHLPAALKKFNFKILKVISY
jgi:hypothetical protein